MMNVEMAVMPEKTTKVVSDPVIARKLVQSGFSIIDIKPKKHFPRETAFVFEIKDGFIDEMNKLIEEKRSQ